MKRPCIWAEFLDTFIDPPGPITEDQLDALLVLLCQLPEELGEKLFPVSFTDPDDVSGILVY